MAGPAIETHSLTIRLFARARDLVGSDTLQLELPEGATVGALRQQLSEQYPQLAGLLARSALAVNDEFAEPDLVLPRGATVALLPPVSGGMQRL